MSLWLIAVSGRQRRRTICAVSIVPVFTVSVQTLQGVVVSGPTTTEPGAVPEKINGSGWVDL